MSNQKQRACIARQIGFEPRDGIGVELIGRLVEDQQIGARNQRLSQHDALALSARERRHRFPCIRDAQLGENGLGVGFQIPCARCFKLVGQPGNAIKQALLITAAQGEIVASHLIISQ